jgi:DNA-binding LacI/PurR family transcriptional regulator
MSPTPPGKRRRTIGLLLANLFDFYEEGFRRAITHEAEALDLNLLVFRDGGNAGSVEGGAMKEFYGLMGPENVDGIIAISACLDLGHAARTPGVSKDGALEALLRGYAPVPVVSVGKMVSGIPSLVVENGSGAKEIVEHMIGSHGLQKIAYIRGPVHNEEADARFEAYRSTLESHGIPFDPQRVFVGDFSPDSGRRAIIEFIDERHVEFDALVGANDYMTIEAMIELQRRGIATPGKVSIGGFDDVRHAFCTRPPLTTVRQPLRDVARLAVENVLAMADGTPGVPVIRLPTEVVVRRSCGCVMGSVDAKDARGAVPAESGPASATAARTSLARRLGVLFPWIAERIRSPAWAEELSDTLFDELERKADARMLVLFEKTVSRGIELGITSLEWQRVVKNLFDTARRLTPNQAWERLGMLRDRSMLLVGDLAEQQQVVVNIRLEREAETLQRTFGPVEFNDERISLPLEENLPRIGIDNLFLMNTQGEAGTAALEYHFALGTAVKLDTGSTTCPVKQLVPGRFDQDHRYDFVVAPLDTQSDRLEYAVFSIKNTSGTAIELMIDQLGRALRAKRQVQMVKKHMAELEKKVGK